MFLDNCYFQLRIALLSFKVSVKKLSNLLICSLNFHWTNEFCSSSIFLCQARFQIYRVGSYKWPMMKIWAQNITSSWILFIYIQCYEGFFFMLYKFLCKTPGQDICLVVEQHLGGQHDCGSWLDSSGASRSHHRWWSRTSWWDCHDSLAREVMIQKIAKLISLKKSF